MKYKLIKWFTVFLVTLAVLSPELLVFGLVWQQHKVLVETQHLACKYHDATVITLPEEQDNTSYPHQASIREFEINVVKLLTFTQQYQIFKILRWFVLLFPIFVGISILVYDRYLLYRAALFQQQVEMLERLWQQSIEH